MACAFGGLIGWERELNDRPAGFRTHILVSVGSALLMIVSIKVAGSSSDPGRIAAQVVSGIGFLGAGTIIREGANVKGLTTAASLWTIAGIGLASGAGLYFSAFVTTGLAFVVLIFLNKIEWKFGNKELNRVIVVWIIDRPGLLGDLGKIIGDYNLNIKNIKMDKHSEDDLSRVSFHVVTLPEYSEHKLTDELYKVSDVKYIEWRDR